MKVVFSKFSNRCQQQPKPTISKNVEVQVVSKYSKNVAVFDHIRGLPEYGAAVKPTSESFEWG